MITADAITSLRAEQYGEIPAGAYTICSVLAKLQKVCHVETMDKLKVLQELHAGATQLPVHSHLCT